MFIKAKFSAFRDSIHTKILSIKNSITIGEKSIVYHKSKITCRKVSQNTGGGIIIGKHCIVGRGQLGYHGGLPFFTSLLSDGEGSKIEIGDNCRINGAYIHAKKNISIGENCVIASGVNIIDSNGHQLKSLNRTKGRDDPKDIIIGSNVWICMNATILKGSIIGDNSIIAAGTVIKGIVPPNSIASNENITIKKIEYD